MPKYRCITMSIMSQWEMKQFPEFPHPDSNKFSNILAEREIDPIDPMRPTSSLASSSPTRTGGRGTDNSSSVSCYIPSLPGVRFFIKWTIEPPHPEGQLFYFKLLINGRHISSWGTNPQTNPRGITDRAFFKPDGKQDVIENGGVTFGRVGIETRPFLFTPDSGRKTVADDGGLIEVRAFRAKAKKRIAHVLERFRPQEQYGISLPSAGLLEKPQDARYYDWILVDRKDEPYAAFHFHYRSWEHLQNLQLIPASHPRSLLKPSNSFAFLAGPAPLSGVETESSTDSELDDEEGQMPTFFEQHPLQTAGVGFLQASIVPDATIRRSNSVAACDRPLEATYMPMSQIKKQIGIAGSRFSMPPAAPNDWSFERPLPELPTSNSSQHSRKTSNSSNSPSITPSLRQWVDRESESPSPEPIIGVAAEVSLLNSPPPTEEYVHKNRFSYSSTASRQDMYSQPSPAPKSRLNPLSLPPEATFLPSDVIQVSEWKTISSTSARRRLFVEEESKDGTEENHPFGTRSLTPSESEWLSRQPIPTATKKDSGLVRMPTQNTSVESKSYSGHGQYLGPTKENRFGNADVDFYQDPEHGQGEDIRLGKQRKTKETTPQGVPFDVDHCSGGWV